MKRDPAGIRTQDPILKRDVLYRLSYEIKNGNFDGFNRFSVIEGTKVTDAANYAKCPD